MDYQVRGASCFVEGRKIGQFHTGSLSVEGGDLENFGDNGGVVVFSDGIITSKLSMTVYEPITGLDYDIETLFLNKTNANLTIGLINGRLYEIRMRCLTMKHDTTIRDGKLEGIYEWGGGKPVLQ